MSEPYIGEIRMFSGNFAPRGWALCDGQLLAISSYDALFSLLGTTYGGDGVTTFGLPDLRGRVPVHYGSGPGLPSQNLGRKAGQENVTLSVGQMPSHTHTIPNDATAKLGFKSNGADQASPAGGSIATARGGEERFSTATPDGTMHAGTISLTGSSSATGGSQSHDNMPPFLCVNFIIALFGIYPSRN